MRQSNDFVFEVEEKPFGWTDWDEPKGRPWGSDPVRDIRYRIVNLGGSARSFTLSMKYELLDGMGLAIRQQGSTADVLTVGGSVPPKAEVRDVLTVQLFPPASLPNLSGGAIRMKATLAIEGQDIATRILEKRQVKLSRT